MLIRYHILVQHYDIIYNTMISCLQQWQIIDYMFYDIMTIGSLALHCWAAGAHNLYGYGQHARLDTTTDLHEEVPRHMFLALSAHALESVGVALLQSTAWAATAFAAGWPWNVSTTATLPAKWSPGP
jgi:hypothetical protein